METKTRPVTFTLQLDGLQLSDEDRRDISEALNDTLMRKLGGLKFQHDGATNQAALPANPLVGQVIRIDGGEIQRLLNKQDFLARVGNSKLNNVLKAGFMEIAQQ